MLLFCCVVVCWCVVVLRRCVFVSLFRWSLISLCFYVVVFVLRCGIVADLLFRSCVVALLLCCLFVGLLCCCVVVLVLCFFSCSVGLLMKCFVLSPCVGVLVCVCADALLWRCIACLLCCCVVLL